MADRYGYRGFENDTELQKKKEVREAIRAGEAALDYLREAREALDSAGNWGLLDIFGGNFISGMIKHSRIDDAKQAMTNAKRALDSFRRELQDVNEPEISLGIDNFVTFADFFFDGILVDVLVQSKISKAKEQVDDAGRRVTQMLQELRRING